MAVVGSFETKCWSSSFEWSLFILASRIRFVRELIRSIDSNVVVSMILVMIGDPVVMGGAVVVVDDAVMGMDGIESIKSNQHLVCDSPGRLQMVYLLK